MKLIYLASPYTHPDPNVKVERFNEVVRASAWLLNHGTFVYSPIAHTHPIASTYNIPGEWQYWAEIDELIISRCDELWVFKVPGWEESTGVQAERAIAKRLGLPERFLIPLSDGNFLVTVFDPSKNDEGCLYVGK